MAKTLDDIYNALINLTAAVNSLASLNTPKIQVLNVPVQEVGQPIALPDMQIPNDMTLIIESMAAAPHVNAGVIQVSEKGLQNQVKPLLPGQAVGFDVTDLSDIVITGTVVGDIVILFCEKR